MATEIYLKRNSLLMKIIHVILLVITFGKQNKFMSSYITTIGEKIYVPDKWDSMTDDLKEIVLVHEGVHIEQYRRDKHLFYFRYLFWPLPCLHAHARLEYELEAYATEIVYSYRKYGTPVLSGAAFDNVVSQMTGPMYFWTCVNKAYVTKRLTSLIFHQLKKTKVSS